VPLPRHPRRANLCSGNPLFFIFFLKRGFCLHECPSPVEGSPFYESFTLSAIPAPRLLLSSPEGITILSPQRTPSSSWRIIRLGGYFPLFL